MKQKTQRISPQIAIVRIDWINETACLPYLDSESTVEEMEVKVINLQEALERNYGNQYTCHVIKQEIK